MICYSQACRRLVVSKRALIYGVTALFFLALRLSVEPAAFKDYSTYLTYYSDIQLGGLWTGGLDLASNGVFALSGELFPDRESALGALYIYLLAIFFVGTWYLLSINKIDWFNYWFFVALFGPLLAFVTIRATPAYLCFFISFFMWRDGRAFLALVFSLLAVLFHLSAILLLPALALSVMVHEKLVRSPVFRRAVLTFYFFSIAVGFYLTMLGGPSWLSGFELGELFIRYSAYIELEDSTPSLFHRAYFVAAVFASGAYIALSRDDWRAKSLVIFASSQFFIVSWSPILAFRQSIYWMAPLLLAFPFGRYMRGDFERVVFAILLVGIFVFSLVGVFETAFLDTL